VLLVANHAGAIASMDRPALVRLGHEEARDKARSDVLEALDHRLSRKGIGPAPS
jgi:hypothetical protein